MGEWATIHRLWEKWASHNVGSSGEPLKAALLLNYDPNGPSRLLSVIGKRTKKKGDPWVNGRQYIDYGSRPTHIGSSSEPLKAALLLNYDPNGSSRRLSVIAEQEGISLKAIELKAFLDFVKINSLQNEFFFIGPNQYLVTSIHEHWFCARCVNTSKPAGEGVIVMQTAAYLLVAMYEGSIGSASCAMVAVDQFAWQLSKRNH